MSTASSPSTFARLCLGLRVWMDLTHWYFSTYENPYEHIADMLCRLRSRWRDMCSKLNIPYACEGGAWPHASLSAIWALTCELVAARTLKPSVQKSLIAPWVELWAAADYDSTAVNDRWKAVDVDRANLAVDVDRWKAVDVDRANSEVDWSQGAEALQSLLPAQLQKSLLSAMKKFGGQALPHVAFACARCSKLLGQYGDQYLKAAERLGKVIVDLLEERFLGQEFELSGALPAGAHEHYAYRCGRSMTRADPRTQACWRGSKN